MPFDLLIHRFSFLGNSILGAVGVLAIVAGGLGLLNLCRPRPVACRQAWFVLCTHTLLLLTGFAVICWFHYRIFLDLPLDLPPPMVEWLNKQIAVMNSQAAYAFPALVPGRPPRYCLPLWIENEKYYFWFLCQGGMSIFAFRRTAHHKLQGALLLVLAVQTAILCLATNPFQQPLPKFFSEVRPWFAGSQGDMAQVGEFLRLYPKMVFYYNTPYMWLHPPMLFLSYCAITITFLTSVGMLLGREAEVEVLGYDHAKFGYFMLTLGMLLGYPWALQAWGPNWWWDPKICASIMMWVIYSTYLHTRLYAHNPVMWYFTSTLGMVCFMAMIFTFVASFFFPGEHTFQ